MSKKNQTVAERAVRGVLGGWVYGKIEIERVFLFEEKTIGRVYVEVTPESVKKMLSNERAEKAKKARRK